MAARLVVAPVAARSSYTHVLVSRRALLPLLAAWLVALGSTMRLLDRGGAAVIAGLGALGVATVVVRQAMTLWRRRTPPLTHLTHLTHLAVVGAAVAAAVAAPLVADRVVGRYPERAISGSLPAIADGPLLPPLLWTTLVCAALGVVAALGTVVVASLTRRGSIHPRLLVASVVAIGFLWRVVALFEIAPVRTDGGDPLYYHTQANTIARGLGFIEPLNWLEYGRRIPTAVHGPGYPLYLSVFSVFGADSWFDHKMASILAGSASVLVAILVTRRLAGRSAGLLAGVAAALYPNLWLIDGVMFPEGLFVLLCGTATLFALRWQETHRRSDAVVVGLSIGFAALTRGEGVFLLGLMCLPIVALARSVAVRRRIASFGWMLLGAAVFLVPWTVRNLVAFDTFVPLSTNGNELHVYSNCDDTYSGEYLGYWRFSCQQEIRDPDGDGVVDFEPAGDEAEKAKYWQKVGFDHAKEHIDEVPKVVLARMGRQWEVFRPLQNQELAASEGRNLAWSRRGLAGYYTLVGLSFVGVRRLWGRRASLVPLLSHFVAVTVTAAYAYGTVRFRAPAELMLCVLAAVGFAPWWHRATDRVARTWRRWWPGAVAGIAVLLPLRGLHLAPGAPMEEGFMLVFPERILRGDIANIDFLHLYGPTSLHLLAAVYEFLGTSVVVERSVGLLVDLAIVAALMALARPWGAVARASAGLLGVLVVFTPIGLTALAWHMAIAFALWALVIALRGGPRAELYTMLLVGLALGTRPDLVLALGAALAVFLVLRRPAWRWRPALLGLALGLTSLVVHLVQAGPAAVWRGVFLEPVFDLRGGRSLPRPPSWGSIDGALQLIGERPPPWWPIPAPSASQQLFIWFFLLPVLDVLMLWSAVRWWRRHRAPRHSTMVVLATFGLLLLTQAMQRPDSTHLLWGSVVAVPLVGCWITEWRRTCSVAVRRAWMAVPLLVIFAVLPYFTVRTWTMHVRQSIGPTLQGLPPGLPVERDGRSFRLGDPRAWAASQEAVDQLDRLASPGDRLLVGPADLRQTAYSNVFFYFLFPELTPATRYIEMDPGLANGPGSTLADDVASADWIILDRLWSSWIEPNDSMIFGSDLPNQIIEQQFCLVDSYGRDIVRLYRRCDGGGAPGPYAGPYDPAWDYAVIFDVPVPPRPDGTSPLTPGD